MVFVFPGIPVSFRVAALSARYFESLSTLAPSLIAGNFAFPQLTRVIEPMRVNQSEPHLPRRVVEIAFVILETSLDSLGGY